MSVGSPRSSASRTQVSFFGATKVKLAEEAVLRDVLHAKRDSRSRLSQDGTLQKVETRSGQKVYCAGQNESSKKKSLKEKN